LTQKLFHDIVWNTFCFVLLQKIPKGEEMKCNKCDYPCPHYHCKICGAQVNNDEKRQEFHPCCSEEHIKIYNNIYNNQNLKIDTNIASFIVSEAKKGN